MYFCVVEEKVSSGFNRDELVSRFTVRDPSTKEEIEQLAIFFKKRFNFAEPGIQKVADLKKENYQQEGQCNIHQLFMPESLYNKIIKKGKQLYLSVDDVTLLFKTNNQHKALGNSKINKVLVASFGKFLDGESQDKIAPKNPASGIDSNVDKMAKDAKAKASASEPKPEPVIKSSFSI